MSDELLKNGSAEKAAAVAAYDKIVESVELVDVRMMDVKFSVKPKYYSALEAERKGKGQLIRGYDGGVVNVTYDAELLVASARIDWHTEVTKGKSKLLNVEATYYIMYRHVPDVGETHINAYLSKVGRFATYPYFRGLVAHLSWESSADLPVMPVLK